MDASQWNAVIAASAAILGGVITQLSVGFGRRGDRREVRRQRLADLRREAVDSCRTSALVLRRVLSDPTRTDLELVNAKSQFEADIARIHDADARLGWDPSWRDLPQLLRRQQHQRPPRSIRHCRDSRNVESIRE